MRSTYFRSPPGPWRPCLCRLPGEDSRSEAVLCVVASLDDLLEAGELEDGLDRAEDLLPGDPHGVLDPREDDPHGLL